MNDEQQKTKAVDAFLAGEAVGDDRHGKVLNRLFPRELATEELPDFAAVREKILQRRGGTGKVLAFRWRFPLYAAAAVALIAAGLLLFQRQGDTPDSMARQAATQKKMQPESYHGSVDAFFRQASGVTTSLQEKQLTLKASELTALFSFEPNAAVTGVTIETRHGSVSVIGTKFIVDSTAAGLLVAVQSGKVRVRTLGKEYLLQAGQELRMAVERRSTVVSTTAGDSAKLFADIQNPAAAWPDTHLPRATDSVREKAAQPITLTLENGATIKGFLQYEDENSLRVRVTAMGQKELTFRKSEILERH